MQKKKHPYYEPFEHKSMEATETSTPMVGQYLYKILGIL